MGVKIVPAGQTADHTPLKKHQCDREAAGHPLPGLLDLSFQNKNQPAAVVPTNKTASTAAATVKERESPRRSLKYWI